MRRWATDAFGRCEGGGAREGDEEVKDAQEKAIKAILELLIQNFKGGSLNEVIERIAKEASKGSGDGGKEAAKGSREGG